MFCPFLALSEPCLFIEGYALSLLRPLPTLGTIQNNRQILLSYSEGLGQPRQHKPYICPLVLSPPQPYASSGGCCKGTNILAMIDMLGLPIIKVLSTPCSQWRNYPCDIFFLNLSLDDRGHVKKNIFPIYKKVP